MPIIDLFRGVHIAAGSLALVAVWIPLFSPKGGRVHRQAGRVFVIATAVLTVAAISACVWRLLFDTDPGRRVFATYLLFVAVLSAAQCSAGVRALGTRSRTGPQLHVWDVGLAVLLTLSGLAVFAWGVLQRIPLFIGFAPVGIVVGAMQLAYWLRAQQHRMHWWFEHMFMMLGAVIGTVSAFAVVNARHLGLRNDSLVVWLGPSALGLSVWAVWRRYYARLFARRATVVSRAA